MDKDYLILKRASASRPSGEWNDDDFDVVTNGAVVGRIMKVHAAPVGVTVEEHPHRCDEHQHKAYDRHVDEGMQTVRMIGVLFRHGALPMFVMETRPAGRSCTLGAW